jgi:ATP-dependent helicase HrpB
VKIDYRQNPPVLAVKLQEMFGCEVTPAVAGGRIPLLIHLLSPAGRPLQVTQDLAGFWRSSYTAVKKEMKGRYPKHPWPDDPLSAEATRYTKRRSS